MLKMALNEMGAFGRWTAHLDWLPGLGMELGKDFVLEPVVIVSATEDLAE